MPEAVPPPRKVFVSHCSLDKPFVRPLVVALIDQGVDAWFDEYEIAPGDDVVAKLNAGLAACDVGVVVFSANTGRWMSAEVAALFYQRVEDGTVLIPVILGEGVQLPPLVRPLARVAIEDVRRLVDAIHHRRVRPMVGTGVRAGASHTIGLALARAATGAMHIAVSIDGSPCGVSTHPALPRRLLDLRTAFQAGFRHAASRSPLTNERAARDSSIADLGRAMAALCLPPIAAAALAALLDGDGRTPGATIDLAIESADPELLALPFETIRLAGDRLLVAEAAVTVFRRPPGVVWPLAGPLPGPLKILVAVGAPDEPDEGKTAQNVLDYERELQNILDAVEPQQRLGTAEVRILEASDPATIGAALGGDQFHVLYLTCHGSPGTLELDDEEGNTVTAAAVDLLEALRAAGRPAPLVFLNTCHGAVVQATSSLAEALLRGGVPAVVAMQTSVTDGYGTALAREFFEQLSRREGVLASRALAHARRALERQRQSALARGADDTLTLPEYATATVFVAGIEAPLIEYGAVDEPLRARPVHELGGQVPQLGQDDLIGRRRELRRTLWVLRRPKPGADATRAFDGLTKGPALALVGLGGVGKSTVAGRAMRRLAEDGFVIASHVGPWDLGAIAGAVAGALLTSPIEKHRTDGVVLSNASIGDDVRWLLLSRALAEVPLLLVLDDFEQNLSAGGAAFNDPDLPRYLDKLLKQTRSGRLLITSRYPLPGFADRVETSAIGPLTAAEVRKLVLRLPGLRSVDTALLRPVLRTLGNHPRVLELLDALVRGGRGRLPIVTEKLRTLMKNHPGDLGSATGDLAESLRQTLVLGARDVFLDELLAIARARGLADVLLQAAVSSLPTTPAGLAHMLADGPATAEAVAQTAAALTQLDHLSLVFQLQDHGGAWVHRWTAEGLAAHEPAASQRDRCARAGRYRWWRVEHESHDVTDGREAMRNFLRAEAWDEAAAMASTLVDVFRRDNQTNSVAEIAGEATSFLPPAHSSVPSLIDAEGQAHLALGFTERAFERYRDLLTRYKRLAESRPEQADFQRDLAVSYNKMGDIYNALGKGDDARNAFEQSLAISLRLAASEPDRADFQRDLAVSYDRMGDLYNALGKGDDARNAFEQSLAISLRLAASEPDRADFQSDLAVSYSKMGDLYNALGKGDDARNAFEQALAISLRLAASEPDRADFQRDLAVSYNKMGDLYQALGKGDDARNAFEQSIAISLRLAASEPDRADFQRDLAVSYNKMGDLYNVLGKGDDARNAFEHAFAIRLKLASSEPDRADFQRDLSVSYNNMGDLYKAFGKGDDARNAFEHALTIRFRLAASEPDRADFQSHLAVSYDRMGDLYQALGKGDDARNAFEHALAIRLRLAASEPDRADFQSHLAVSYDRMGDLYQPLGNGDDARNAFEQALAIRLRLTSTEPDRADFQRDLAVSYDRMGDLYRDLGNGDDARNAFEQALDISLRLAASEPDRADFQSDLAGSYIKIGDLYNALGNGDDARNAFERAFAISLRLAASEPDRADFQRDLAVSYDRMGDLYQALGNGDDARNAFEQALAISLRLAASEPDRADFQRDLAVSYNKMGDLYKALGKGDDARNAFEHALAIILRLASSEPDRADFQRDLSVSYNKMGDLYRDLGKGDDARKAFELSLDIRRRLAASEPDRADFQRDLAISYERVATVSEPAETAAWLAQAVAIRRGIVAMDPAQAITQRELGIALLQQAQAVGEPDGLPALTEAATILVGLRRADRLEAQYHDLADELATSLTTD